MGIVEQMIRGSRTFFLTHCLMEIKTRSIV